MKISFTENNKELFEKEFIPIENNVLQLETVVLECF